MSRRGQKIERVVYEEKPQCGRCGADIVGVIPKWRHNKPLCRECSFELEQLASKPGIKSFALDEVKEPLTPEEKKRRAVIFAVLTIAFLALGLRILSISPLLQPARPLRHGTFETDATTDRCIEELWKLSRQLQDGKLPGLLPLCPLSGKGYVLVAEEEDTRINCPNPVEHGLSRLTVSRKRPIPLVLDGGQT